MSVRFLLINYKYKLQMFDKKILQVSLINLDD